MYPDCRFCFLHPPPQTRSPDKGEREPEARGGREDGPGAGRRHRRALQHHLLRHAGGDPALPPHPRARLHGAAAAAPAAADRLLPEDHGHAAGGPAEVRRGVAGGGGGRGGDRWPPAPARASHTPERRSRDG